MPNTRRPLVYSFAATQLLCLSASAGVNQISFQGVGDLPGGMTRSTVSGLSADGSTAVGLSGTTNGLQASRWTSSSGLSGLGDLTPGLTNGEARAASVDGGAIVGWAVDDSRPVAVRWTAPTGLVSLGRLPGDTGSNAFACSSDASAIVGYSSNSTANRAFRWTSAGMVSLGDLPGGNVQSEAFGVSGQGDVVVGLGSVGAGIFHAFRWTQPGGMVDLGTLPNSTLVQTKAFAISGDGAMIVGVAEDASQNGDRAWRWDAAHGMAQLPGLGANHRTSALCVSADGRTIGGFSGISAVDAVVWTDGVPFSITQFLTGQGIDLTGWSLGAVRAISADGLTIAGFGSHNGDQEGWVATIPAPATGSLLLLTIIGARRRR